MTHYLSHGACADDVTLWTTENETMRADHARSGIVGVSGSGRWRSHRAVPRNHECCHWRPRHAVPRNHRCCHWRPRHAVPRNYIQSTIMNFPLLVPINSHLVVRLYSIHHHFPCSHFCAHFCTAKTRHLRCGIYTLPSVTVDRRHL